MWDLISKSAAASFKKNTLSRAEFAGTEKDSFGILRHRQRTAQRIARNSATAPDATQSVQAALTN